MANDNNNDDANTEPVDGFDGNRERPRIDRLGQYRIVSTLGAGGMATIYRAHDDSMKREIALKVLHSSLGLSSDAQSRFVREAWIAGQLDHPNIIKVYGRGEEQNISYISMELAEGGSMKDFIETTRRSIPAGSDLSSTTNNELLDFLLKRFIGLASALEHIHSKGFTHRDIKPHNILITGSDKEFKLSDFGIAHADDMTKITKAGDFIGTVRYMSPELLAAHRGAVDHRTDIYSLGITLYEALTLSLPFEAVTEERLITEILSGHYIAARKVNRRIPKDLETVLTKAANHDPDLRYQTAGEFAADLEAILESRPIRAKPEPVYRTAFKLAKRNRKLVAAVALTGIVLLASFYVFFSWVSISSDRDRITRVLNVAMAEESSPFQLDEDWPRLAERLYDDLAAGRVDTNTILYLKANNLPDATLYQFRRKTAYEYHITMNAVRLTDSLALPEIPSPSASADEADPTAFTPRFSRHSTYDVPFHSCPDSWKPESESAVSYVVVSTIQASINPPFDEDEHPPSDYLLGKGIAPYQDIGILAERYELNRSCRTFLVIPLTAQLPNEYFALSFRAISQHYIGARLFVESSLGGLESYRPTFAGPSGKSLVEVAWTFLSPTVLDNEMMHPAKPVLIDTLLSGLYLFNKGGRSVLGGYGGSLTQVR